MNDPLLIKFAFISLLLGPAFLGFALGIVVGWKLSVSNMAALAKRGIVKPKELTKELRTALGVRKKAVHVKRLDDDEAAKLNPNSPRRHSDLVVLSAEHERE